MLILAAPSEVKDNRRTERDRFNVGFDSSCIESAETDVTTLLMVSVLAGGAGDGDVAFGWGVIKSATLSGRVVLLIERTVWGLTAGGVGSRDSSATFLGSGSSMPKPTPRSTGDVSLKFIEIGEVVIILELSWRCGPCERGTDESKPSIGASGMVVFSGV